MKPVIAGITHEVESIFQSVARYTRFVSSTKWILGALALVLMAFILLYPYLRTQTGMRIAFTSIEKKTPGSPTQMVGAKFHGLDKSNQPFNVNAKTATQLDDNTVSLDHLAGDITLKGGAWFSVTSDSGIFKMKENTLDLKGSIEMFDDAGYEFRTERMHVDAVRKTAVTDIEIKGQGPLGTLRALSGATIDSNVQVITFNGPVFVTLYPATGDKTQENDRGNDGETH